MSNEIKIIPHADTLTVSELPVSWIDPRLIYDHPIQGDTMGPMVKDPQLWESVAKRGIKHPLRVRKPDADGRFRGVSGHRRRDAAIEAGMPLVPAFVIDYEFEYQEELDYADTNIDREKTSAQVNALILVTKNALEKQAKTRQSRGLRRGRPSSFSTENDGAEVSGVAPDSPSFSTENGEESGRTADLVAQRTGRSKSEVVRRLAVCDPEYSKKFFDKIAKMGASVEDVEECSRRWTDIRRKLDTDEVSVSGAANEVKELQAEFEAKYAKGKSASAKKTKAKKGAKKGARSAGKRAGVSSLESPAGVWPDGRPEGDFEEFVTVGDPGASGEDYGLIRSGAWQSPAVRYGGKVWEVPYSVVFEYFIRPRA